MSIIALDIGNTRIKAAEFESGRLIESVAFDSIENFLAWLDPKQFVERMVIGSVGPDETVLKDLEDRAPIHLACTNWKTDVEIKYQSLETLGIDRLAGMVAAWDKFQGASVVFDMGSCMTIDYIDNEGQYHGGNISPGWKMRLRAMHDYTARLPLVETLKPDHLLGLNTKEALQLGAFNGLLFEMKGYIDGVKQRNDELNVILTGGDAFQFAKYLKMEIFVLPDLILEGLHKMLHANI